MQKKTLNINFLETSNYSEEDYRDFIREAGFDPDELYNAFGQFIEGLDIAASARQARGDSDELHACPESKEGDDRTCEARITDFFISELPFGENIMINFKGNRRITSLGSEYLKEKGVFENN